MEVTFCLLILVVAIEKLFRQSFSSWSYSSSCCQYILFIFVLFCFTRSRTGSLVQIYFLLHLGFVVFQHIWKILSWSFCKYCLFSFSFTFGDPVKCLLDAVLEFLYLTLLSVFLPFAFSDRVCMISYYLPSGLLNLTR